METQPIHTIEFCDTCATLTDWTYLYGLGECTECGNEDPAYDPFLDGAL